MMIYIYLAPRVNGVSLTSPVFRINGKYLDIATLQESTYPHWHHESLFGIPFDIHRKWNYCPFLIETTHGGFILDINDDFHLNVGAASSSRSYSSRILEIYPLHHKLDHHPLLEKLLVQMKEYHLTLNEFLGIEEIRENDFKITCQGLLDYHKEGHLKSFVVHDRKIFENSNVIVVLKLTSGKKYGTVVKIDKENQNFLEPGPVAFTKI